jgi:hypothetical protein
MALTTRVHERAFPVKARVTRKKARITRKNARITVKKGRITRGAVAARPVRSRPTDGEEKSTDALRRDGHFDVLATHSHLRGTKEARKSMGSTGHRAGLSQPLEGKGVPS